MGKFIKALFGVLYICRYILFMLFLGCLAFLWAPESKDLCIEITEDGLIVQPGIWMLIGGWWGFQIWFAGRMLLHLKETGWLSNIGSHTVDIQRWLPRVLGFIPLFIVFCTFLKFGGNGKGIKRIEYASVAFALDIILFLFFIYRRKIWPEGKLKIKDEKYEYKNLNPITRYYIWTSLMIWLGLIFLFIFPGEKIPLFIGTQSIVNLAFLTWTSALVIATYFEIVKGYPVFLILIAWIIICSFFNENHQVRLLPGKETSKIAPVHDSLKQYFVKWCTHNRGRMRMNDKDNAHFYKAYIVTVAGGASRTGYWASHVLGSLQDANGKSDFMRHVFCMSTVSGGTIGATMMLTMYHEQLQKKQQTNIRYTDTMDHIMAKDFLAPVMAKYLFAELFEHLLPFPLFKDSYLCDRQVAIEEAFENSARKYTIGYDSSFLSLYQNDTGYAMPSLFLNTTRVETGQRAIFSQIYIDTTIFSSALSSGNVLNWNVRISTAAGLTARFPYVAPAARIMTKSLKDTLKDSIWGHTVDGGYFEYTGIATGMDIYKAIIDSAKKYGIDLRFITIRDDYQNPVKNLKVLNDLLEPPATIVQANNATTSYFEKFLPKEIKPDHIHDFNLNKSLVDVPLNWVLSKHAQDSERVFYLHDKVCIKSRDSIREEIK